MDWKHAKPQKAYPIISPWDSPFIDDSMLVIYMNHPSYLLFLPLPLFVPEFLVRTLNICSYLLFLPRLFFVVSSFFWFYTAAGLRFGFKRHMLKLVWIGQVWIVSQGPITPMGPSRSLEPTFGDVREIWDQFVAQKRAKSAQKRTKKRKNAQIQFQVLIGTQDSLAPTQSCQTTLYHSSEPSLVLFFYKQTFFPKRAGNLSSYLIFFRT
jgi:hypothetical protein